MRNWASLALLSLLAACASGGARIEGGDGRVREVPACSGFEEVARLPSDIETPGHDPKRLLWFEAGGGVRLGIRTLQHVDVWDVGTNRPQLAYRVPATTSMQPIIVGDGAFLVVNRGRPLLVDSRNQITPTGSDTYVVDTTNGTELRRVPPLDESRPAGVGHPFPLPGTTLLAAISARGPSVDGNAVSALVVVDAATGRVVAERNFGREPLPPGRIAARPNRPLTSAPYHGVGSAAASQGGALLAFTTSIAEEVTLPDGRRGWVQTRAVDVWTLDGPNLRLLRTITVGGFRGIWRDLLAIDRDGRHALVALPEVQSVNEVSGVSHLHFPRTAPPRLVRVDLVAGRVVAETEAMLPRSRDTRSAQLVDMALDPQGRFVALSYGTGVRGGPDGVLLFNPVTLAPICNLDFSRQWVGRLSISSDGALLSLAVDATVRVLRIPASVRASAE
jgi:hypothetical protein